MLLYFTKGQITMKNNRIASIVYVLIAYVVATVVGVLVYKKLSFPIAYSLLVADVVATIVVFAFGCIVGNASVYDPYWSVQPLVIGVAMFSTYGISPLSLLMFAVVFVWGVRLTGNWLHEFHDLTYQDWRYTMLAQKTKFFYPVVNFLGIHLVPTLVVWGCVLPLVDAIVYRLELNVLSVVFVALGLGAVVLQTIADVQMHKFRKNRTSTFMRQGLWKYSRHPNYLGEICLWWCMALACVCAHPSMWYLCAGALANTLLFAFVSIPMADGRQSKKPGWDAYKKQTRALLPIYKKQ